MISKMKKPWILVGLLLAVVLSLYSYAFDPLPSRCVSRCSSVSDCGVCISACESYIGNYADINAVRSSILARETVNTSGYDGTAVYNLERCWCSSCCDYNYGGDSAHPCIYPCPCTIRNSTANVTTTTVYDRNRRPDLNTSLSEIEDSVNYNLCFLLNLLWMVVPGIAAIVIMWAGSRYMAADEDPAKRTAAKGTIAYAIAGLALSLAACPAVDYLIVNTDITPFHTSCKCYQAMTVKPGVPPTLPYIANVTTQKFVQTTHGVPPTIVHNGTTSSTTRRTTTTTTSTTQPCLGPCQEYQRTKVLPAAFDWRNVNGKNYMTAIRDQGSCGSCWAHALCGATEGTYNVEQCKPGEQNMAEQDLVSCSYNGRTLLGCNGGDPQSAYTWFKANGVCQETCFPYRAADVPCSGKCSPPPTWRINSYVTAGSSIAAVKAYLICHGPLSVASDNWMHAITLAGYDDNSQICQSHYGKAGCWIIKNSWGGGTFTSYGVYHVGGYGYIPYSGHSYSDIVGGRYPVLAPVKITKP